MMKSSVFFIRVCLWALSQAIILYSTTGLSYEFQDDLYYEYYTMDNSVDHMEYDYQGTVRQPTFLTNAMDVMVNEGSSLRLPCQVDDLQGFVLLWKRHGQIISIGTKVVEDERRYLVEEDKNGNYLVVRLVQPSDAGEYTCQVSAYKPRTLRHKARVRTKPVITIDQGYQLFLEEGDPLDLSCSVLAGSPQPNVTWVKGLGSDQRAAVSQRPQLSWSKVSRMEAGTYICQADNGFDVPEEVSVLVDVGFAPEVEVSYVRTPHRTIELSCEIRSHPQADVAWYNSDRRLRTLSRREGIDGLSQEIYKPYEETTQLGLVITDEDIGNYSCVAINKVGNSTKSVFIPKVEETTTSTTTTTTTTSKRTTAIQSDNHELLEAAERDRGYVRDVGRDDGHHEPDTASTQYNLPYEGKHVSTQPNLGFHFESNLTGSASSHQKNSLLYLTMTLVTIILVSVI